MGSSTREVQIYHGRLAILSEKVLAIDSGTTMTN
jgi:hypothetical protein